MRWMPAVTKSFIVYLCRYRPDIWHDRHVMFIFISYWKNVMVCITYSHINECKCYGPDPRGVKWDFRTLSIAVNSAYYCFGLSSTSFRIWATAVLTTLNKNYEKLNRSVIYYIQIVILHLSWAICRGVFLFSSSAFTFAPSSIRTRTIFSRPDNEKISELKTKILELSEWITFKGCEMKWCRLMCVFSINICTKFNESSNYIFTIWKMNKKTLNEET